MEKEKELIREEIENYAGATDGVFAYYIVRYLARALLAEMDKPKDDVWKDAPEHTTHANITFLNCNVAGSVCGVVGHKTVTRTLPKTRARVIAEEAVSTYNGFVFVPEKMTETIESAILKALAEKEAGKC